MYYDNGSSDWQFFVGLLRSLSLCFQSVSAISVVLHHVMTGQVFVTVSLESQVTYVTDVRYGHS